MEISVRLFAMLRERAGRGSLTLHLDEGATVADALCSSELEGLTDRIPITVAVNREYALHSKQLFEGDELALVPPVSGGALKSAAPISVEILKSQLSPQRVVEKVASPHAGAIVTFYGTTRDVPWLEYEAYAEMAVAEIKKIAYAVAEQEPVEAIAVEHRIGVVPLGETSVIIAVSAAHRPAAFAAASAVIDQIKQLAPIWKKEVEGDSSTWVSGTPVKVASR